MDNNIEIDPKILEEIDNRLHTFQNDKDETEYNKKLDNLSLPEDQHAAKYYYEQKDNIEKSKIQTIKNGYTPQDNEVFVKKITELLLKINKAINEKNGKILTMKKQQPNLRQRTYTFFSKKQNSAEKSNLEFELITNERNALEKVKTDIIKLLDIYTKDEREWNNILKQYTSENVLKRVNESRETADTNENRQLVVFGQDYNEQVNTLKDQIKKWWEKRKNDDKYKTNGIYRIFTDIGSGKYNFFIEDDSLYAYMTNFIIRDKDNKTIFDDSKLLIFKFNEEDKNYNKILNGLNALLNPTTGGKRKNKKTKKQKNKKTKKQKNKKETIILFRQQKHK